MDTVTFSINGKSFEVGKEVTATTSLNDFIRHVAELRGTKYMCQEGGCGACVVSVCDSEQHKFSVNSCLVSILSCDGWEITTIEGIGNRHDGYNVVQKRLDHFFGSQCGYCSPGFIMNMHSLLQSKKSLTPAEIEKSFGSNLCRCTGYRPILEAFKSLATDPDEKLLKKIADIEDLNTKTCPKSGKECKGACDKSLQERLQEWCLINKPGAVKEKKLTLCDGRLWYSVNKTESIFKVLNETGYDNYMLVAGNTSKGAYPIKFLPKVIVDINNVAELREYYVDVNLVLGANMTLAATMNLFEELCKTHEEFWYLHILYQHLEKVAHIPVRNIGTLAGNLVLKHEHPDFQSDVFLLLDCIGATLTMINKKSDKREFTMKEFMNESIVGQVITNIKLPPLSKNCGLVTYKVAAKEQNAHAQVNAAFLYNFKESNDVIETASIVFGGINPHFSHALQTEKLLIGRHLFDNKTVQDAVHCLAKELKADVRPPEPSPKVREKIAIGLFYKGVIKLCPEKILDPIYESGATIVDRPPVSHSYQEYDTDSKDFPLTQPLLKREGILQCAGEARYSDDEPGLPCEVFAAFVLSDVAIANIDSIDSSEALKVDGVLAVYTSKDIPGDNTIVTVIPAYIFEYEELLASTQVKYYNQPVAIVVATSQKLADETTYLVKVKYRNARKPIVNLKDAIKAPKEENRVQEYDSITPTDKGQNVKKVVKGTFHCPPQYHHMMELHTSVATPVDDRIKIKCASQYIDSAQMAIGRLLNMPEWHIEIETSRCGGAFGCKIFRSNFSCCATALVAKLLNRPCRMSMHLRDIMRATGKRTNSFIEYEVGVDDDGCIQYLDGKFYIDDAKSHNENENSYAVDGFTNCYDSSRWTLKSYGVITDKPVNCYMRAPGTIEGMAGIEHIMDHIAYTVHKDPADVRMVNYRVEVDALKTLVPTFLEKVDYHDRMKKVEEFNSKNRWKKRGIHMINMAFHLTYFGNYSALVSVYNGDGSVVIHAGGVEIGQGIYTRLIQVAAKEFCIDPDTVTIQPVLNTATPNNTCTGSSITTDCVAYCIIRACEQINDRLKPVREDMPHASFKEIVKEANNRGILLQANYLTSPNDPRLIAYYIFGVALQEVEVDILTGRYWMVRADIFEDPGKSINPALDVGQVEGAFVQGLGMWTVEHLVYNDNTGELYTDRTWNYHILGAKDIPHDFRVYLRRKAFNPVGILGSKAVGEPPICLAYGIVGALRNAVASSKEESYHTYPWINLDVPVTNESIVKAADVNLDEFLLC